MRAWNGTGTGLVGSAAIALLLAGCTAAPDVASTRASANEPGRRPAPSLPAGAPLPTGASIASMSEQYAHPRPGPVPAAGASAWVPPAPAPAFVSVTARPPSDPPEPPLAAVANRQPGTPAPAAPPPRSAAALQPAPAVGVDLAKGRQLFGQYACAGCHILADAGGAGGIGPSLDNNPRLTRDFVIGAVSEGRGAMPAYRDQMSAEEIAALADYIVEVSRK